MANIASSLLNAGFADCFSAMGLGFPSFAGSAFGAAIDKVMSRRAKEAREIFLDTLGAGLRSPRDPGEIDEFVAIVYRYMSKAQEGAARINLRLMAGVVAGQIEGQGLYASGFLRYSEMLASLSREEVILLATRYRLRIEFDTQKASSDWRYTSTVNDRVVKDLVPKVFPTPMDLTSAMTALQRTGLIWPAAATTGGGFVWQDTPMLDRVMTLARVENALRAEGI